MRDFIKKGTSAETMATLRKSSHENKHLRYFTVISYCLIKQCPQFRCNWTVRKLKKKIRKIQIFLFLVHIVVKTANVRAWHTIVLQCVPHVQPASCNQSNSQLWCVIAVDVVDPKTFLLFNNFIWKHLPISVVKGQKYLTSFFRDRQTKSSK